MRIAILTNVYPNKYGKSDGVFVYEQVKTLESMGNQVDVLYIDLRSIRKKRKWGLNCYSHDKTQIYHYSFPCGPIPFIYELLYLLITRKVVFSYLEKEKNVKVIHGHFYINGFWAKDIKKEHEVKYILTEHSSEFYEAKISKLHTGIMKRAYKNVDEIISVSEVLKRKMNKYTKREIKVIPNVLPEIFSYSKPKQKNEFVFLSVGHVIESKGMNVLIKSFEKIQKMCSDVSLRIVGDGELKKDLEHYCNEKKLNVFFYGEVEHSEIPNICKECQCFVLPSEKETFGIAYIEALACGLPVIATKCGGPEEFVSAENGILIPINEEEALVCAMKKMYESYLLYDSKKISDSILEQYGSRKIGERLMSIYL